MALTWTNLDDFIADSPGAVWDESHAQEIKDNIDTALGERVTGTLNSTTGTVVNFSDKGKTDYELIVSV